MWRTLSTILDGAPNADSFFLGSAPLDRSPAVALAKRHGANGKGGFSTMGLGLAGTGDGRILSQSDMILTFDAVSDKWDWANAKLFSSQE
jgi:hypothetical protein